MNEIPINHPMHPNNSGNSTSGNVLKAQAAVAAAKEQADPFNRQIGGNHYKDCTIQPVEYIVANDLDFCCGNVVKYVTRFKVKGNVQDLLKAKHYIELKLASLGEITLPPYTAVGSP